jgi:hypothetical protein
LLAKVELSQKSKEFIKPNASNLQNRFEKNAVRGYRFKELSKLHDGELVTLLKAYVFLGLFETTVTNLVDLIIMFFIADGHDFYVYNKRAYAHSLDDLDEASLGEKLIFLNRHGLQVFSQNINKELRNKVAHMDFDIEPDGKISIENQRYDLDNEIYKLMGFLLLLTAVLEDSGIAKIFRELS